MASLNDMDILEDLCSCDRSLHNEKLVRDFTGRILDNVGIEICHIYFKRN